MDAPLYLHILPLQWDSLLLSFFVFVLGWVNAVNSSEKVDRSTESIVVVSKWLAIVFFLFAYFFWFCFVFLFRVFRFWQKNIQNNKICQFWIFLMKICTRLAVHYYYLFYFFVRCASCIMFVWTGVVRGWIEGVCWKGSPANGLFVSITSNDNFEADHLCSLRVPCHPFRLQRDAMQYCVKYR